MFSLIVQARDSISPAVRKVIRPSSLKPALIRRSRPVSSKPAISRYSLASSSGSSATSLSILAETTITSAFSSAAYFFTACTCSLPDGSATSPSATLVMYNTGFMVSRCSSPRNSCSSSLRPRRRAGTPSDRPAITFSITACSSLTFLSPVFASLTRRS